MITMISYRRLLTVSAGLFLWWSALSWDAAASTIARDVAALNALKKHWLTSPFSYMPDWQGPDPCGQYWIGVTCSGTADNQSNQVTKLSLTSYNLSGGIPLVIGSLTSLQVLELSFNPFLGGTLPVSLGQLTSLKFLSIKNSGLTGSIPDSLGSCVNLTWIGLNHNSLTGPIPDSIGYLKELSWFDVSENSLAGPLPVSSQSSDGVGLDNLTNCKHFHFNNNSITGGIPDEMFNLDQLVHMLLDANLLQGSISTAVANAKGLKILKLESNQLSGPIPPQLNGLTNLLELNLNNNSFTETLPNLSALTKLQLFDVSGNQFDAEEVPRWIYSMSNLQTIRMDSAHLTGPLDPRLFSLPAIQTLSLSNNTLNGTVSFTADSPSSLVLIDLQNNFFTASGSPTVNGIKSSVIQLWLAGNPFCSDPNYGGSAVCRKDGTPEPWKAPNNTCDSLCKDEKTMNPKLCKCAFPLKCNIQLTAPSFQTVNNSLINQLTGEYAKSMNLDSNQLYISGADFENSRMVFDLNIFPLSGNALTGPEVKNITSGLSLLNYSITLGPYLMRGFVFTPIPISSSKASMTVGIIVGIVAGVVVLALIIALIAIYAVRQKRRADKAEVSRPFASWGTSTGDPGDAPQLKGARWFSLTELKIATNYFHPNNELGVGGYGKVYKAKLPLGDLVAVKRAEERSMQGATEFKNEIELLSRVHHKHLVGLIGFCYEQGEQMLVYEFMPNGTLHHHILGHAEAPLSWDARVAIALGSAKGIAYLHEMANPPIIHRDIKSSNILLDEKMIAKVADFGLSKLAPDVVGQRHVSTQVKGTLGYLDPEYYMTNQLSEKSDVYSFGVVLLEILSARQPIERGRYIVREVRTALNKGGVKAMEPLLDPFLTNYPQKQLEAFLDLALHCVEETAIDRPSMNEVVKELEVIAANSKPNSGIYITIEPQKSEDGPPYGRDYLNSSRSFQYSGAGFMPEDIEPK